jgi:cell cycle arrest protein BUB3
MLKAQNSITIRRLVLTTSIMESIGILYTGGWDSMIYQWDPRSPEPVGQFLQPGRIFDIDLTESSNNENSSPQPLLVVATHERKVLVYDRRMLSKTYQMRESPLRYMTRVVKCLPNGQGTSAIYYPLIKYSNIDHAYYLGFAISSIEGRIAVEYFDTEEESQVKKFAFKCHRQTVEGEELVYPVNAIEFHPTYVTH